MKHKCVVKGCANRGTWIHMRGQAYCQVHLSVLRAENAKYWGCTEEGRKVGKPRAWAAARQAKEADADA